MVSAFTKIFLPTGRTLSQCEFRAYERPCASRILVLLQTIWATLLLSLALLASGCLETARNQDPAVFSPTVTLECASAQASDCSVAGSTMYVGLLESLAMECENYLASLSAQQLPQAFDALGQGSGVILGVYLTATITQWKDTSGSVIDVLLSKRYKACAFVDANGNSKLDRGEAVGDGEVLPGSGSAKIVDWYNY